jgi:hypothetical protein
MAWRGSAIWIYLFPFDLAVGFPTDWHSTQRVSDVFQNRRPPAWAPALASFPLNNGGLCRFLRATLRGNLKIQRLLGGTRQTSYGIVARDARRVDERSSTALTRRSAHLRF